MPRPTLHTAATPQALALDAAAQIARHLSALPGMVSVALAGGSTPKAVHAALAGPLAERMPWGRIDWYWGDERLVPADDPDSNQRMARETLLDAAGVAASRMHPIADHGGDAVAAAAAYDAVLAARRAAHPDQRLFSLVLLGLGSDGHTASLFPGHEALGEEARLAVPVTGVAPQPRVSLTAPALRDADAIMFLVTGASKAPMLARLLAADPTIPASLVLAGPAPVHIFADEAAAAGCGAPR